MNKSSLIPNIVSIVVSTATLQFTAPQAFAGVEDEYFCADYADCRERFRQEVESKTRADSGSQAWSSPIPEGGDDDLTVDFGFFPAAGPGQKRLLILSSGIHGLEGYVGSAVQRLFLTEILPQAHQHNVDVLMLHGINAFGMKHQRRHTANRVDLNRNWFTSEGIPEGIDDHVYDRFSGILNPGGHARFSRLDFMRFTSEKVAPNILSVVSGDLTKAAGQGQYRYPQGLTFGGTRSEPHRKLVTEVLDTFVPQYNHVLAMDLHTGLGRRELQLLPNPPYSRRAGDLRRAIFEVNGRKIQETGGTDFYMSHGDFSDFICQYSEEKFQTGLCANMLIEYGTLMPPSWEKQGTWTSIKNNIQSAYTLYVAVRENQAYVHGAASIEEGRAIRKAWSDMFNPDDQSWRKMVLDETRTLFPKFLERFATIE